MPPKTKRRKQKDTTEYDVKLGNYLYQLRTSCGLTRSEFGKRIGVTHQQLHKYEKGENRITVSRLNMIADTLNTSSARILSEVSEIKNVNNVEFEQEKLCLKTMNAFNKIKTIQQKELAFKLIKAFND